MSKINFHIVTLFPESFSSYLETSIIARAIKNKIVKVYFYNPRDFAKGKLRKKWPDGNVTTYVDDRPYGGGPGMVLRPEPILEASKKAIKKSNRPEIILFSASGKTFSNVEAEKWLKKTKDFILICGRYEGVDKRVAKILKAKEISIGPYVLTGGEIPALVLIDAISRRVEGVLNKQDSIEEKRVSSSDVYTRPDVLHWEGKKIKVPKVLLTGHKKNIEEWKEKTDKKAEKKINK